MSGDRTTLADESAVEVDVADLDGNDKRSHRAKTERMIVVPDADLHGVCSGLYTVVTTGGTYDVALDQPGACTCPDAQWNSPEGGCKHRRRVAIEINETDCPSPGESVIPHVRDLRDLRETLKADRNRVSTRILIAGPAVLFSAGAPLLERAKTLDALLEAF